MGRLRKVLVGAVAALATLAAGLVGAGTANAVGSEHITLEPASSTDSALTAANYKAYELVGYTPNPATGTATSVAAVKLSDALENAIANALHTADPSDFAAAPNAQAEHELLNLSRSTQGATIARVAHELSQPADRTALGMAISGTQGTGGQVKDVLFNNLNAGLYLILDSSSSNASLPIIVSSTLNGGAQSQLNTSDIGSAKVKTSTAYKPTKTQTTTSDPSAPAVDAGTYTAVGDTAHFKITMTVPDDATYQEFRLIDTPSGYNIDHSSVKFFHQNGSGTPVQFTLPASGLPSLSWSGTVTPVSGAAEAVPDGGFILDDHLFTHAIPEGGATASWISSNTNDNSIIHRFHGQTLIVTYDATVTSAAAANAASSIVTDYQGNNSGNPGSTVSNGGESGEPLATFRKVSATDRSTHVSGAQFYLLNSANHLMERSTPTSGVNAGHLTWTATSLPVPSSTPSPATEANGVFTTDSNGHINLDGLSTGTYTLREVSVPTPYMQTLTRGVNTTDVTIHVNASGVVSVSAADSTAAGLLSPDDNPAGSAAKPTKTTWTQVKTNGVVTSFTKTTTPGVSLQFSLGNLHNITELPATGGAGIIAGIILVALLLAIGGSFIAISRKMHKDHQQAEGVRA